MSTYYGMEIHFTTEKAMQACVDSLKDNPDIRVNHDGVRTTKKNDTYYLVWGIGRNKNRKELQDFIASLPDTDEDIDAWTFEFPITNRYIRDLFSMKR